MEKLYIAIVIIIIILAIFMFLKNKKNIKKKSGSKAVQMPKDEDEMENYVNNPKDDVSLNPASNKKQYADSLVALGYTDGISWDENIKITELDPATFINQQQFVKDVRRFSSGANFTSVTDDNTNLDFVNFVGLRRNEAIPGMIGATARQIPDIDENVLTRTKVFRWNSTS